LHIKATVLKVACHQLTHIAVVFNQQDAGLHGITLAEMLQNKGVIETILAPIFFPWGRLESLESPWSPRGMGSPDP
jgi:hypothetical protein